VSIPDPVLAFGAYILVDWSAAAVPRLGRDAIWVACLTRDGEGRLRRDVLENLPTRDKATAFLAGLISDLADMGLRVLVGFDFPFGYPRGTGAELGHDGLVWRRIWAEIDALLDDAPDNANNRFAVGAALNRRLTGGAFPFWGQAGGMDDPCLARRNRRPHGPGDLPERRLCEARVRRTQPVWKLAYTGSVGSQALTGIPRVWALRTDPRLAFRSQIWPFETGLSDDPKAAVILAEVYPSLVPPEDLPGLPKDAGQVVAVARALAHRDAAGELPVLFAADPSLSETERRAVETEEAWILGVTHQPALQGAQP